MKFLFNKKLYKWTMTGLLGNRARWFLGFSTTEPPVCPQIIPDRNDPIEIVESYTETGEAVVLRLNSDHSGMIQYRVDGADGFQKIYFGNVDLIQKAVDQIKETN